MTNPADRQLHAFATFMGGPPDINTPPACGAIISRTYGTPRPVERCATCDRLVAEYRAKGGQ